MGLRTPKRTARSGTAGSNWGEHREAESSKVSSRTEETTLVSPRARYAHHDPTHKPRLPNGNFVLSQNGYGLIPRACRHTHGIRPQATDSTFTPTHPNEVYARQQGSVEHRVPESRPDPTTPPEVPEVPCT